MGHVPAERRTPKDLVASTKVDAPGVFEHKFEYETLDFVVGLWYGYTMSLLQNVPTNHLVMVIDNHASHFWTWFNATPERRVLGARTGKPGKSETLTGAIQSLSLPVLIEALKEAESRGLPLGEHAWFLEAAREV